MLVQVMILLFCQNILADHHKPVYETNDFEAIGRHFEKYLQTHKKIYDETEKVQRFLNFIANLKKINELNVNEESIFDINHFTDWSEDEVKSLRGFEMPKYEDNIGDCKILGDPTSKDAPAAFDWRDKGAVSPVKNQKDCYSCWAFSTNGLLESRYYQQKKPMTLSEQQLMDCDKTDGGCASGGLMCRALTYIMKNGGQETDAEYPYENKLGSCRFDKSKVAARVLDCTNHNLTSEDALKELLFKEGPIAIAVAASTWEGHSGSIWQKCDDKNLDHGVLLVGYGTENGVDFWIVKNSWGPEWGEKGYIRMQRGVNCNGIGGVGANVPYAATTATVA